MSVRVPSPRSKVIALMRRLYLSLTLFLSLSLTRTSLCRYVAGNVRQRALATSIVERRKSAPCDTRHAQTYPARICRTLSSTPISSPTYRPRVPVTLRPSSVHLPLRMRRGFSSLLLSSRDEKNTQTTRTHTYTHAAQDGHELRCASIERRQRDRRSDAISDGLAGLALFP